jgi:hypothetical protein
MTVPETPEEMETRLLGVIAPSQCEVLADDYMWEPMPLVRPPQAQRLLVCAMAMAGIN